jgi:hypothetical protein
MQTDNGSVICRCDDLIRSVVAITIPVIATSIPHYTQQIHFFQHVLQSKPPGTKGRPKQLWANAGSVLDRFLRPQEFSSNYTMAPKPEVGMGVGMIADLMAGRGDSSREFRQSPHVASAHKECGWYLVAIQSFKNSFRSFARTIIEGQGDTGLICRTAR